VEALLPKIIKAPVSIEAVELSPFSGAGTVRGIVIGNPEGYKTEHAFKMAEATLKIDLGSLTSDTIVIDEITLIEPQITYEVGLGNSNLTTLKENALSAIPTTGGGDSSSSGPGKKIHIRTFHLQKGQLGLSAKLLAGHQVDLPRVSVQLTDIKAGSPAEALSTVLGEVVNVVDQILEAAGVTKIISAATDTVKGAGKAAGDTVKKIGGGIKGIFNKKE
jgi:uncharacterized protein involved in outer membrane biogenesis